MAAIGFNEAAAAAAENARQTTPAVSERLLQ